MPIIHVQNAGSLSREQTNALIEKLTAVIVEVTGKSAQSVYTRIEEVPRESFGVGGKPLA